jgi:hypothetical protein
MRFSADETTDLGSDSATPVSDDYGSSGSEFNARVRWVQIDIDESAELIDHLITPDGVQVWDTRAAPDPCLVRRPCVARASPSVRG